MENHHYEREEESGPYAESYWICKIVNVNNKIVNRRN